MELHGILDNKFVIAAVVWAGIGNVAGFEGWICNSSIIKAIQRADKREGETGTDDEYLEGAEYLDTD